MSEELDAILRQCDRDLHSDESSSQLGFTLDTPGLAAWLPDYVREKREPTWVEKWQQVFAYQMLMNGRQVATSAQIGKWIADGELTEAMYNSYYDRTTRERHPGFKAFDERRWKEQMLQRRDRPLIVRPLP